MKFEHTEVFNFEGALRGMRNPKDSWDRSDSYWDFPEYPDRYIIGEKDMTLAKALISGGGEHRKFLRQIFISVDITAPLYFFKEFDTYKLATVANSTSTMHKLTAYPITIARFENDGDDVPVFVEEELIPFLEILRERYLEIKDTNPEEAKKVWKQLVKWLPMGWCQTRTWTANYEVLRNIYHQRKNHRLTEWHDLCRWIENLPYAEEFLIN